MSASLAQYRALFVRYVRPRRRQALGLAVLLLGSIALQLANPLILRRFIDGAVAGAAPRTLVAIAGAFIVAALLTQAMSVAATWAGARLGWSATNDLRTDLALHCLRLDMPFHHTHIPGEMIERIDGDITALADFFSLFVVRVLGSALLLVGILALLFREDARVGLALTAFALLALLVLARCRELAVPHRAAERQATAEMFGFVEERLAGLDDIRAHGAGPYVMRRFHEAMRHRFRKARTAELTGNALWVITTGLFTAGYALALALSAFLYQAGAITIGTVYLVFQYTELLRRPLEQITQQLREFQRAGAGVGRVHALLALRSAVVDGPAGAPVAAGAPAVEFDRVSFAYDDEGMVLHEVSFAVPAGQVLGVLGRTGSGKTTLARLLLRLYDATDGAVQLNGVDVRALPLDALRAHVGMVTQEVQLFQASVRDNLTFFDAGVPDARLIAVLDDLGLGEWLRALPDGLDTELAAGGAGVSAGEAQLLAFARVFLRDPGLVVLDEASSRLDPATERRIERAVDRLLAGRTGIVIAHRLATVQRADAIVILEEGRVVEHGPRAALARDPASRFAHLLRTGLEQVLV
jgi:ATP-binding cassette subfamily B protein